MPTHNRLNQGISIVISAYQCQDFIEVRQYSSATVMDFEESRSRIGY